MTVNTKQPTVIGPQEGELLEFEGSDAYLKINGTDTDQQFAVAHEIIEPQTLSAPLHYHHNEDEYSYVVEGTLGAMLGNEVVEAEAGTWVAKPRHQWHAYWNPGETPCHVIEVISPPGFETFFSEAAEAFGSDEEEFLRIAEKYDLDVDLESIPELCDRFDLSFEEG